MAAIPSKASFTGTTVTQGQFKTALDSLNDYLTGLLGSDGTAATARTASGRDQRHSADLCAGDCRTWLHASATRWYRRIRDLAYQRERQCGHRKSKLNSTAGAGTYNWTGQSGQPTWVWGGNDGTNFYVYNPSNFSVNYAGSAGSVPWTGVSGRPTAVADFQYSGNVGDGIGGALAVNALVQVATDNTVRIYRNTNCNCNCDLLLLRTPLHENHCSAQRTNPSPVSTHRSPWFRPRHQRPERFLVSSCACDR